jgi:PKD domain
MRRFIAQPVLAALALALPVMVLGGGAHAATVDITFEGELPSSMTGMSFTNGMPVPSDASKLRNQLQVSHGVSFSSGTSCPGAGYVALVRLGNRQDGGFDHATSGVNGIGGVAGDHLQYGTPIVIRFTVPGDPATPAVTDFVSIKRDLSRGSTSTATMQAFDVNNNLLLTFGPVADDSPWELSAPVANIHCVVISQTPTQTDEGRIFTIAFDDLSFNPLRSALGQAPVANAGADKPIKAGQTVTLDGSGSSDDDTTTDKLVFAWTMTNKPQGSSATLTDANTMTPSFVADRPGDYTVSLTVTDAGGMRSAPDTVVVASENLPPVANAGEAQGVFVGTVVSLNGSSSQDPNGDSLGFSWTLAIPAGSSAALTDQLSPMPMFTPDVPGDYVATLTVSDPFGATSAPASVVVSAIWPGNYAQTQVVYALNMIGRLTSAQVTTRGNQNAMQQHLGQVLAALRAGDAVTALDKLMKTIERTDGCVLRGAPDGEGEGRDWITDWDAQARVYQLLMSAAGVLAR